MHLSKAGITSYGHKPWSNRDLAKLSFGYQQGFTIKVISMSVNRTVTATNKALTRHGIRNYLGPKKSRYSDIVNHLFDATSQHVNDVELKTESEEVELESLPDDNSCEINAKDFNKPAITPAGCALLDCKISPRIKETDIYTCVKIKHVINELIRRGIKILPLTCPPHKQQGYQYLVDGKPCTPSGLLLLINKLRSDQGLPVYFIDGLTEY